MAALEYWLWLSSAGLSPRAKADLIERYGDAEAVFHAPDGAFSELRIDPSVKDAVKETDLWVRTGDPVERFSGANKAIGTLVLNFPDRATLDQYMSDDSWYQVIVS